MKGQLSFKKEIGLRLLLGFKTYFSFCETVRKRKRQRQNGIGRLADCP